MPLGYGGPHAAFLATIGLSGFVTVFLKRGLVAEHGSSWLLPRLVGVSRALDLLWMSDRIDAQEAHALGLVDRVCEPELLLDQARDYVRRRARGGCW